MINTFEFIEIKDWCKLASDENDFLENEKTYLPLFNDELTSIDKIYYENLKNQDELFFSTQSNGGFRLNDLISGQNIGGSFVAHLGKVLIKDSSLLILVQPQLSLVEGYGNRRWADYQLNKWPLSHNFPIATIKGDVPSKNFQKRIKLYQINTKVQKIPISGIYLSVRADDANIYHWLLETLIRLKCLEDVPKLKELPLIIRDPLSNFQIETLKLLGVENKLIVTNGESFEINDLYFPSIPSPPTLHRSAMKWLRNKFLYKLPPLDKKRRLYISRVDSNRQLSNEDEIWPYLNSIGFEKLIMSTLSVRDQIDAFRVAECIVLPHGAAGSHLLFIPLDCKVLEFHSPAWINNCYLSLCNTLNIQYDWIIGTLSGTDINYNIKLEDVKKYFSNKINFKMKLIFD